MNAFLAIVAHLAPIVLGGIPETQVLAPIVTNAIGMSEAFFTKAPSTGNPELDAAASRKTGAQKLAYAGALVDKAVEAINAKKPGAIDQESVDKVKGDTISTIVDTANLIHSGVQAQGGVSPALA